MLAIVIEHTSYLGPYVYTQESSPYWAYLTSIQIVKFGTIAFFIIAGFLFTENSAYYSVQEYLSRRFDNIFKPWLIWSLAFLALLTGGTLLQAIWQGESFMIILSGLWWGTKTVYLNSNYWFIINFFFCTTVLLLSKKVMHSWQFGLLLFLLTSFYSVNIYAEWVMPQHTTAIFGFVFFYWLGVQLNLHLKTIKKAISRTSHHWFILAAAIALFIAVHEASYLYSLEKADPINTLRFSNILFSIAVFALLLKIKNLSFLSFLQPRKTTFGIFLIHYILVFSFLPFVMGNPDKSLIQQFTVMDMYKYQFSRFFIVYILSFVMVQSLNKSRFSWIIGARAHKKPVSETQPVQAAQRSIAFETEAA